jgi:antitoxin component of MazEF toxin-antitoxin module
MIQSIQKIIKIGSSGGVTIPAKELKRQNINFGDEVEVIVRPLRGTSSEDRKVLDVAKKVIEDYKQDFENLSGR